MTIGAGLIGRTGIGSIMMTLNKDSPYYDTLMVFAAIVNSVFWTIIAMVIVWGLFGFLTLH
jgi:hypothetical protein